MLFSKSFDKHTSRITDLINKKFKECKTALELLKPSSPEPKQTQSDPEIDAAPTDEYSNGKEYDFFRETLKLNNVNTELDQYNKSNFPMDKKGCALGWWKVTKLIAFGFQEFSPFIADCFGMYFSSYMQKISLCCLFWPGTT
jgi:hypothetical protein